MGNKGWIVLECALQIVKKKNPKTLFLILEPSGIFVKSITKSSAVEHDGRIQIGDQIIAVSNTFNKSFVNFHG